MSKRQKVSFIVTTEEDVVIDDLAVEMNCAGFGEIEHIEINDNPLIPLTEEEVKKFNKFAEDVFTCCLCKGVFTGWSNNAEPLVKNGRCCKKCDNEKVIPERIRIHNVKK
jgi:hypothetical protein